VEDRCLTVCVFAGEDLAADGGLDGADEELVGNHLLEAPGECATDNPLFPLPRTALQCIIDAK
jgi:hypothetical protein